MLSNTSPEKGLWVSVMLEWILAIGGMVLGCVASVFGAYQLDDGRSPRSWVVPISLLGLGTVVSWIGLAYGVFLYDQTHPRPDLQRWVGVVLAGGVLTGPTCLGIGLVTLFVRRAWKRRHPPSAPTGTSRQDSIFYDQMTQTTSVSTNADGNPYQRPATRD